MSVSFWPQDAVQFSVGGLNPAPCTYSRAMQLQPLFLKKQKQKKHTNKKKIKCV